MKQKNEIKSKNIGSRVLIAILLTIIIVVLCIGMYAWAKYTTSKSGNGTAQVAKWYFDVKLKEGKTGATETTEPINLASTEFNQVASGKIAPGTSGLFYLIIDTSGTEVDCQYDVRINLDNCPRNINFYRGTTSSGEPLSIGGTNSTSRSFSFSNYLAVKKDNNGTIVNENGKHEEAIYWEWPYDGLIEGNSTTYDEWDTADADLGTTSMTINVTGTQVMNNSEVSAVSILQNKKVSILGDSISTLKTYIPATNRTRYVVNQEDAVGGLIYIPYNETWWGRLINNYNMTLGINESWAGSRVSNNLNANSGDIGPDRAMASITRIQALDDNGTPDVIFFFGGTNDIGNSVTLGSFDNTASYATTLDITSTKYNSFVEAYSITLMRLKHYYPNATIIALLPLSTSSYYSDASLAQYKEQMKSICDFHNVKYIDLGNAGINSSNLSTYLVDGIHPNSNGMQLLSNYIVSRLNSNFHEETNGENNTNTHLQTLPENITPSTNLYTALTPELGYYSDSKYDYANDNGKDVISITIPVQEGDHISANSFGISAPAGVNKSGIRCTMLNDGKIVRSLSPSEVYSSYKTNGYVEIPSGVNSVNIAWWGEDESNWAHLGDWNGHAQLLPENLTSSTNLYTSLTPKTGFYNATEYTNYKNVVSITIPVQEGDRVSANSFGTNSASESRNGIRCTMLSDNRIVNSLTPDQVYSAYTSDGYVEIPSGVNFVNIAWWETDESNWAHLERP